MNENTKPKRRLSKISALHYFKLVFRSGLFLAATIIYIYNRIVGSEYPFGGMEKRQIMLIIIWLIFVVEMVLRFFPASLESMGCQKQFRRNYTPQPQENAAPKLQSANTTAQVAVLWLLLNTGIGALYSFGVIDEGIMLLISLAFSVCDMICILFFCPFQTWFMKNKCCGSCRIYNWDYAMMFTPLIFVKGWYTWSILIFALALLLRWEIAVHRYPERFSENTNACLSCANCKEKLCHHKKQLQQFLKDNRKYLHLSGNMILGRKKEENSGNEKMKNKNEKQ